jgi:hypothetical protein
MSSQAEVEQTRADEERQSRVEVSRLGESARRVQSGGLGGGEAAGRR